MGFKSVIFNMVIAVTGEFCLGLFNILKIFSAYK